MPFKAVAHAAQQTLRERAGCEVKRGHVHELLAAAFGFSSWAAFTAKALLADGGVGGLPGVELPPVVGRALQLHYSPSAASALASVVLDFLAERQISSVQWSELTKLLAPGIPVQNGSLDGEDVAHTVPSRRLTRDKVRRSELLVANLEHAAESGKAAANYLLASLYKCVKPSPYLYEESLKGRLLTVIEQRWVEEYLQLGPQFERYQSHLKAAALGGVQAAALDYAAAFDDPAFFELAERLPATVDPMRMAGAAFTLEARTFWLRKAMNSGSRQALEALASDGDEWAETFLAETGEMKWLQAAADRALAMGDALGVWTWQYLALAHDQDLTYSTMAAYHSEGAHAGEFYDSDFGGSLHVAGDEGLELPAMTPEKHEIAKARAHDIFNRIP